MRNHTPSIGSILASADCFEKFDFFTDLFNRNGLR